METTRLSSKGQVILPKAFRDAHNWKSGQEFVVVDTPKGILLKPRQVFEPTKLDDVAGCLAYQGIPKSLDEINAAISKGVKAQWQ